MASFCVAAILTSQFGRNVAFLYDFGSSDGVQNGVERSQPERIVVRDGEAVMLRSIRLKDHVAAFLVDLPVAKMPTEHLDKVRAAQVTGQLHAVAKTSSLTKCNRTLRGLG